MKNTKFNKIICKRVKDLRIAKGLTIEQLAYQSGISKGGLSEIERSLKEPMTFTVLRICSGLGIAMSEFFDFDAINEFENEI